MPLNVRMLPLMAYRLAPQAEAELETLPSTSSSRAEVSRIADRVMQSIAERFDLLAEYPRAGRGRDDLRPGIRSSQ